MKVVVSKGKILEVKRLKNSCVGNPTYKLKFETGNSVLVGKTAANAVLGYQCYWTWEGEEKTLAYHFTRSGNVVFDRLVKEVK